jgi:hypothetical protein
VDEDSSTRKFACFAGLDTTECQINRLMYPF